MEGGQNGGKGVDKADWGVDRAADVERTQIGWEADRARGGEEGGRDR